MNIGLYISELLSEHDYVILHGFGAFVPKYVAAKNFTEQGWIDPPSRMVAFNPALKMNDGILLHYVAQREGLTAPKALAVIDALVADYLYSLDHGKPVVIKGLGTVSKNGEDYTFHADPEATLLPEAFGLERVLLPKKAPEKVPSKTPVASISGQHHSKRKMGLWLYVPLLLIMIATIVWLVYQFIIPKQEQISPAEVTPVIEQAEIFEVPPVTADSINQVPQDSLIQDISIEREHPREGIYYVIGGSFRSRENAEKYFEQAIKRGHQPFHLGEIGKFHVVALAQYSTQKEAFRHQMEIHAKDSTSGVWVYSVRKRTEESESAGID